jgi:tetratricopeptide (TPR) repeat protein
MGVAFIELGRFNEAIAIGKKALHQNPSYSPAYRCLASAFAHLGRDAEAREAAALGSQADMPEQNLSNLRPLTLYCRRARKFRAFDFSEGPPGPLALWEGAAHQGAGPKPQRPTNAL